MSAVLLRVWRRVQPYVGPTVSIAVFATVAEYWASFVTWLYGVWPNKWIIDNLAVVPSWWPAALASAVVLAIIVFMQHWALIQKMKPRLKLSFDKNTPGCIRHTHFTTRGGDGPRAIYFRIKTEYLGTGSLRGCTGYLVDVTRNGVSADFGESLQLTFALAEEPDALSKTIVDKVPQFLDIGFVLENGQFGMATKSLITPNSLRDLFATPGDYGLRVVVASSIENIPSEHIDLVLHLTGNWKTTEIESLKASI